MGSSENLYKIWSFYVLWKVLSEFPGEDQSAPPLRFSDITDLVIIRNQLRIIKHVVQKIQVL